MRIYSRSRTAYRLSLRSAAIAGVLCIPVSCGEGPTAVFVVPPMAESSPLLSLASVTTGNTVTDGTTEIELQSDGMMRVRDISSGDEVFAELDAEQMEEVSTMINDYRVGDANYAALNNLNPYENAPPGYEPFGAATNQPPGWFGASGTSSAVGIGTSFTEADSSVSRPFAPAPPAQREFSIVVRKTPEGEVEHGATPLVPSAPPLGPRLRRTFFDGPTCTGLGDAIGAQRYQYLNSRTGPLDALASIAALTGAAIKWVDGKPVAKVAPLQGILVDVATEASDFTAQAVHLNVLRGLYNAAGCQGAILVNPTPPSSQFPVWPGGAGWSSNNTCYTEYEWWQVSYDGGTTWSSISVSRITCSANAE